ncbi:chromosome segregation protein Csm1/Pcs1-domain-containing protein [Dactylonectria macrodidyma]|uniref:Chromosome segregation protein Csm1/Pcs1-domain-containing protein n=1 Tax=Dactylonectria macrodidyma TaxID=307937 RepID=A0A9P9E6P3_9HYPO|nr:chromosome segregation protein Csm1/Pcs1-domain-containing protein [Dactylonectria macrodidyma]
MPRAKATAPLAGLVGSDTEPDFDDFDVSDIQAARNQRQPPSTTKRPRGRPPSASKVTKPTPRSTVRARGRPAASRAAQQEAQSPEGTTNVGDMMEAAVAPSTGAKTTRGRPRGVGSAIKRNMAMNAPTSVPPSATRPRGRPRLRQAATPPEEIPETQEEAQYEMQQKTRNEILHNEPEDAMDLDILAQTRVDTEPTRTDSLEDIVGYDVSDVSLRRRLGDLTKKYESLEMRHRDLREVGVKEAERNFDRLRKQAEERATAANKLIAELKKEIAAHSTLAKQVDGLQKTLEASDAKVETLENTIETLNASLAAARSETKTISTKLAAFRAGEANVKVPGSTLKAGATGSRTALAEAAHAANHVAQAKEDLYGDLTDLILRNMRQDETEDVFDCIQTGRNGTLHFKLAVEIADPADNYEEVQFTYRPQLDPNRDAELMDILPEYLGAEITFPRRQASRFYARVMKYLTEPPE